MPTARRNVTRERVAPAEKKRREMEGKKHKPKKESPEDKLMQKDKITSKEAGQILTKEAKARKIKREQDKATKKNKPGISATNKNLT